MGLPVWRFDIDGCVIEKRIVMPYLHNTVHVTYTLLTDSPPVDGDRFELYTDARLPPVRLAQHGGERPAFVVNPRRDSEIVYRVEQYRGYPATGHLWSPGYMRSELTPDAPVSLIASTEDWSSTLAVTAREVSDIEMQRRRRLISLAAPAARTGVGAELVLAADQFVIRPAGRVAEQARAHAAGRELRTVIAGYHWFTDWGRDTMISLEGLTLTTGRFREASHILQTFADYTRDGLIPNMFPDRGTEGLYHTADATLWFFHAADRYLHHTGDRALINALLRVFDDIIRHHVRGTHFGIHVDPHDGLLVQGQDGYQLTWMDAKVDGWVVTPRRGKAVEINALWYNALRLLAGWHRAAGNDGAAAELESHAHRAQSSFNRRFWYDEGGYLYDVVDGESGNDAACRPNQIFAVSLDYPVLAEQHWPAVVETVRQRLLTPVGLRSLSPDHAAYEPQYFGDLRTRDAAYHQGTVWAWLIGPFVDAWLRVHPEDRAGAHELMHGLAAHLDDFGVGTLAEIFDAEHPFTPRGCIAQAWSVAELLRCWVMTMPD